LVYALRHRRTGIKSTFYIGVKVDDAYVDVASYYC